MPKQPDVSEMPNQPAIPETSQQHDIPETPNQPAIPAETSKQPEIAETSKQPDIPETPKQPAIPAETSKQPSIPETPEQCIKLTKKIMKQAQEKIMNPRSMPPKFNDGQCKYLADKLGKAFDRADQFLEVFKGEYESSFTQENKDEFLEIFKLLSAYAMEADSFIRACCEDEWIPAAVRLTNASEHVSTIAFNLELCAIVFSGSRKWGASESSISVTELVDKVNEEEVGSVQEKASLDKDALLRKLENVVQSLLIKLQAQPVKSSATSLIEDNRNYQLGSRLLKRLKPIRAVHLQLGSIPEEGLQEVCREEDSNLTERERLGKGGFGTVHTAEWHGAVKVAKKKIEGTNFSSIKKEVSILGRMSHSNIATLLCYTQGIQFGSIVTKLMDKDLLKLIEDRVEYESKKEKSRLEGHCGFPFTLLVAVDIMLQFAGGMCYMHEMEIAHRDLKSQNILVRHVAKSEYVLVEITDFGESKVKERNMSDMNWNSGTLRWKAPELIEPPCAHGYKVLFVMRCAFCLLFSLFRGENMSSHEAMLKCDVHSFAMVCYEILTGKLPFYGIDLPSQIKKVILNGPRPTLPHRCPTRLKSLIERCWNSDPSTRPSFGSICAELRYQKYEILMICAWGKLSTLAASKNGILCSIIPSTRNPSWSMIEKTSEDYARNIQRMIEMESETVTSTVPQFVLYSYSSKPRYSWSSVLAFVRGCCSSASSSATSPPSPASSPPSPATSPPSPAKRKPSPASIPPSPSSSSAWYYLRETRGEFSTEVESEIETTKVHWSQVDPMLAPTEQLGETNRTYFELLKRREYVRDGDQIVIKQYDEEVPLSLFCEWDDRLVVGEKIAEGGQAEIYEAALDGLDSFVAKVFKAGSLLQDLELQWPPALLHIFQDRDSRQRSPFSLILGGTLLKETRFFNSFAIVMHKKWGDLRTLIDLRMIQNRNQGRPFTTDQVLMAMFGIARDMVTLHSNSPPILHGDLKASNILVQGSLLPSLDGGFEVTVCDYECSRGVVGTGFWRAPELLQQWKNRVPRLDLKFSRESDVYSYGMTCYEIVTGRLPFEDHPINMYGMVLNGGRPELPIGLDSVVKTIITSCWNSIPSARPSFKEIVKDLQGYIERASLSKEGTSSVSLPLD